MARRYLLVDGCDDYTVADISDLTPDQIAVVETVAKRVTAASTTRCHPRAELIDENHYAAPDPTESESNDD